MTTPRILAFSGSARRDSFNQRVVAYAARVAEKAGAEVTVLNLRDLPLPIMDQDLERDEGQPENAARLKALMAEHDGFIIGSPEYNSSLTPLLKNALDWASRKTSSESSLIAYDGKIAALMSASPGKLGGVRGLVHLRQVLTNLGVLVIPGQASIGGAMRALDDSGNLVNEQDISRVESVVKSLLDTVRKL
ncbi:MAG: NAD(P)H-dependent oxidoreductase, partial [Pseudomonadota bacterium]